MTRPVADPIDLEVACAARGCRRPHRHGEARTKSTHRCPCQPCRSARWRRDQHRAHARHRGTATPQYGPADQIRDHIQGLLAAGATLEGIGAAAGVHRDTVYRLSHPTARQVQAGVKDRLLGVRLSDTGIVGTTIGARRRLRALSALGWSSTLIGAAAGMHPRVVAGYMSGDGQIRTAARSRILAAYLALWDREPPRGTSRQRAAASKAVRRAAALGWVTPMAWDDIDVDDSPAYVAVDDATVDPVDVEWMLRTETSSWAAADRLGITRDYLLRVAARCGIPIPAHIRAADQDRRHTAKGLAA